MSSNTGAADDEWAQGLVGELEQADNEDQAFAALSRLRDETAATYFSGKGVVSDERREGDVEVAGYPGFCLRTISGEEIALLESGEEAARKLLGWKVGAVIMLTMSQFGSTQVQHACVEALFSISNPLDATPSDTALLLSSFCDELDYECRGMGPFAYCRAWGQSDVCVKLLGAVPLLRGSSSSVVRGDLTAADIDDETDCYLPDFMAAIGHFARMGWAMALVGSGALGVMVVVANLLSPHTSSRETNTTSHFTLQACYDAVPHLLDVRQNNGWDPDFFC